MMSKSSKGSGLKDEDVDLTTLPGSADVAGKVRAGVHLSHSGADRRSPAVARLWLCTVVVPQALMAFLKIIAEVSRSRDLLDCEENTRLSAKIPGYYVRLQYGLHAGW